MFTGRFSAISIALLLGACSVLAQGATPDVKVTYSVTGTLSNPALSGPDPLGAAGGSGTVSVSASETLKPTKHTTTSATYRLPAGAITASVGGATIKTNKPSTMVISIPAKGSATVTVRGSFTAQGTTVDIAATIDLAHHSFPRTILRHPVNFTPTPQTLTAATTPKGHGSKVSYRVIGQNTILGISGTATSAAK